MPLSTKTKKNLLLIVLVLYLLVLFKLIFAKMPISYYLNIMDRPAYNLLSVNVTPLKTIIDYLGGNPTWQIAAKNILGNILLFAPFGFLIPQLLVKRSSYLRIALLASSFSLLLETAQLLFGLGSWDIDDIILNTMGAIVGFIAYKAFDNKYKIINNS